MGCSRQEQQSGLPFLRPGDLSNPRIKLASPAAPALRQILYLGATREALIVVNTLLIQLSCHKWLTDMLGHY